MELKEEKRRAKEVAKQNSELRGENRKLRARLKELELSNSKLREKNKELKKLTFVKQRIGNITQVGNTGILRHKYDELMVSLCVNIYITGGCGFRGVHKIISLLNKKLNWGLDQLPCKSTVENWVQKAGYHLYKQIDKTKYEEDYSIIVDECMVMGQERMIGVLGIPAVKTESEPLKLSDADILGIHVKPSWNGDCVSALINTVTLEMGKAPKYVISDGGGNIRTGFVKSGLLRINDIGHQIALFLEQIYKKDLGFIEFNNALALNKFKEVMKPTAYLLPPQQRSIARFMNLSSVVKWAQKMIAIQPKLKPDEEKVFSYIVNHKPIIEELNHIIDFVGQILEEIKYKGLSHLSIKNCIKKCESIKNHVYKKAQEVIKKITDYLKSERDKLPDSKTIWHASSDIIESLFGKYKEMKSPNKLHGVTPFVLALSLYTKVDKNEFEVNVNFKTAMEKVYLRDIASWSKTNLIENQVRRRSTMLKTEG
jgi:hypothetical protein